VGEEAQHDRESPAHHHAVEAFPEHPRNEVIGGRLAVAEGFERALDAV
jgi:hypothetical protein